MTNFLQLNKNITVSKICENNVYYHSEENDNNTRYLK